MSKMKKNIVHLNGRDTCFDISVIEDIFGVMYIAHKSVRNSDFYSFYLESSLMELEVNKTLNQIFLKVYDMFDERRIQNQKYATHLFVWAIESMNEDFVVNYDTNLDGVTTFEICWRNNI